MKIQTQSSADRITTSFSLGHQRKNKQITQHKSQEAHTNHWANLRRAETKRKKKFKLEAWKKETSNTISYIYIYIEKAEKYYTKEGTT